MGKLFKNIISSKYTVFLIILIVGYVIYKKLSEDKPTKEEKESLEDYVNTKYSKSKSLSSFGRKDTSSLYRLEFSDGTAWYLSKSWVHIQITNLMSASNPYFLGIGTDEELMAQTLADDIKNVVDDSTVMQASLNKNEDDISYNAYAFVLQCYKESFGLKQYWRIPEDIFNSGQFVTMAQYVRFEVSPYWTDRINNYYNENQMIGCKI